MLNECQPGTEFYYRCCPEPDHTVTRGVPTPQRTPSMTPPTNNHEHDRVVSRCSPEQSEEEMNDAVQDLDPQDLTHSNNSPTSPPNMDGDSGPNALGTGHDRNPTPRQDNIPTSHQLLCLCEETFSTVLSLVEHARPCLAVHSSARAKTLEMKPQTCLLCNKKLLSNRPQHERAIHCEWTCGEIHPKRGHKKCAKVPNGKCHAGKAIDTLEYLLGPPEILHGTADAAESLSGPRQTLSDLADRAMGTLRAQDVNTLLRLPSEQLSATICEALVRAKASHGANSHTRTRDSGGPKAPLRCHR